MDATFTEDQLLFRKAARDLLQRECPPSLVRAAWSSETATNQALWSHLADQGILGLTIPEAHGGLGLTELDLILVLEETGRAALPDPLLETTAVCAPLLAEIAPPDLQDHWLPRIAQGNARLAIAFEDTPFVNAASSADLLLLTRDGELHALLPSQVHLTPRPSVDGARKLAEIAWQPTESTRLATASKARSALEIAFDRGALAASAQLLGLAQQMLDLTVEHAKLRAQFGKPIGSFQAVKHHLADALLALEMARPVVYRAAHSLTHHHPSRALHVSAAKSRASEAALLVARKSLQCHGAIGYSFEHDLHLWMKRAWALAAAWGDPPWHRARIATSLL